MTHSGGKPHNVGDKGQRYEVIATGWPAHGLPANTRRGSDMLIEKYGKIEIWLMGDEYYVYGVTRDPRVCPSLGMAREVAAGA